MNRTKNETKDFDNKYAVYYRWKIIEVKENYGTS
jgi:hypothetical protein